MPNFDIVKKSNPEKSFRVASIMGKFDLASSKVEERFTGNIDLPDDWQIGLIVGGSGTGKTTIAKELFKDSYITNFKYSNKSILDDMPENCSVEEIANKFNSVGFSSPPSWLKSYDSLSNGQKMRVDLANALLRDDDLVVFDEFTSVVDRKVAQTGSFAIQKAVRKTKRKFIAVTCHFDVGDWLMPDWIFNADDMSFCNRKGQKKNRPEINLEIFKTEDKSAWKVFSKHHYLSHNHNNAAHVYLAYVNQELAGFISILHFPHPKVKNMKKVHRLVVLPDYQGLGIGVRILNEMGKYYTSKGFRYTITTSSPSLIHALKKSKIWRCKRFGKNAPHEGDMKSKANALAVRLTAAFEIIRQHG